MGWQLGNSAHSRGAEILPLGTGLRALSEARLLPTPKTHVPRGYKASYFSFSDFSHQPLRLVAGTEETAEATGGWDILLRVSSESEIHSKQEWEFDGFRLRAA